MHEPIEELYFDWLYTNVVRIEGRTPSTSYRSLLFAIHSCEYQWLIIGDDNRAADGEELRKEFLNQFDISNPDPGWLDLECSVLEMLVAFSRRCAFQTAWDEKEWFWVFLDNLHLSEISDGVYEEQSHYIYPAISTFVGREYNRHGVGGIFPMIRTRRDQRNQELWNQFSEYLVENDVP